MDTFKPGRQSLALHKMTTPAKLVARSWPTKLQTPNPAKAITIPTTPPTAVAIKERAARFLKANLRCKIDICVLLNALIRKLIDNHLKTEARRGSSKKVATNSDTAIRLPVNRKPAKMLTQKAVSRCSGSISARWTIADPKP